MTFYQYLVDQHEDFSKLYFFSEVSDTEPQGWSLWHGDHTNPTSKEQPVGLQNVFFEIDLADQKCKLEEKFTTDDSYICANYSLNGYIKWVHDDIHEYVAESMIASEDCQLLHNYKLIILD